MRANHVLIQGHQRNTTHDVRCYIYSATFYLGWCCDVLECLDDKVRTFRERTVSQELGISRGNYLTAFVLSLISSPLFHDHGVFGPSCVSPGTYAKNHTLKVRTQERVTRMESVLT